MSRNSFDSSDRSLQNLDFYGVDVKDGCSEPALVSSHQGFRGVRVV